MFRLDMRNCVIAVGTSVGAYMMYKYYSDYSFRTEKEKTVSEGEKEKIALLKEAEKYTYMVNQLQLGENALIDGDLERGATLIAAAISGMVWR